MTGATLPGPTNLEGLIRKRTGLQCNTTELAEKLTVHCDKNHQHVEVMGSAPGLGARARAAGGYPQCLSDFLA